jgi:acyl carrier protein
VTNAAHGEGQKDRGASVPLEAVATAIASRTGLAGAELRSGRSLRSLGVSSFAIMHLVLDLEDLFEMEFAPESLKVFATVPVADIFQFAAEQCPPGR